MELNIRLTVLVVETDRLERIGVNDNRISSVCVSVYVCVFTIYIYIYIYAVWFVV